MLKLDDTIFDADDTDELSQITDEEFTKRTETKPKPGAKYALIILTCINLLNYMDRWIPSATKDLYKEDLDLSDAQTSIPATSFTLVYLLTSPIFGVLADRGVNRRLLMAGGIVLWSIATACTFFSSGFWSFLFFRTLVGIGEAAYATITPALLSDFYPPNARNRALTIFYTAIPVGAAIGFGLGGVLGQALGWRYAFLLCGIPGIIISLLILFIQDPGLGRFENFESRENVPWVQTLSFLAHNQAYRYCSAGAILITFAIGGLADWIPTYLVRVDKVSVASAGLVAGAVTVIGGIVGTMAGGYLADYADKMTKNPYFAVSALALAPAVLFSIPVLAVHNVAVAAICLLVCQCCVWVYNGPMNAVIANNVPANMRARAFSVNVLLIHLLGDAISPVIIGKISDATGSLVLAVLLCPITMALAGVVWGLGWHFIENSRGYHSRHELPILQESFDINHLDADELEDINELRGYDDT